MRTGIDLLKTTEALLIASCGCEREKCRYCAHLREVKEYLDTAGRGLSEKAWEERL